MNREKLRILTVADVPPNPASGAGGTVLNTNRALIRLGHDVDEIWSDDLGPRRIHHGNLHSLLEQPRAYRTRVMQRVKARDYDVIQLSQPQAYMAVHALKQAGFKGLIVNRSHGVELRANTVLGEWHHRLGVAESRFPAVSRLMRRLLDRQWKSIARECDGVIVGCTNDRIFLEKSFSQLRGRVAAIAHGVEASYISEPQLPFSLQRARRVLHVGQYAFFKGSTLIPSIVNSLLSSKPDVSFTWVCDEKHHGQIRSQLHSGIASRVNLHPWVEMNALRPLLDDHGLFLFPSLFEGFGKAPIEAMARGLCVVASDEGGMADVIESGVNGCLVSAGDVAMFAARLVELSDNVERMRELSALAIDTAKKYSWQRCAILAAKFYVDGCRVDLHSEGRCADNIR